MALEKTLLKTPPQYEHLRIDKTKRRIKGEFIISTFIDSDTNQVIVYCPALNITGYGSNAERANVMFDFNVDQYFAFLIDLKPQRLNAELSGLGWLHDKLKNKEYSKSFVDMNGELKNFNILKGSIELQQLTAV